jgi:hypothetical protein
VNSLSVFDVVASMNSSNVAELHPKVVASNCTAKFEISFKELVAKYAIQLTFVHLDLSLVDFLGREDNQNCVPREAEAMVSIRSALPEDHLPWIPPFAWSFRTRLVPFILCYRVFYASPVGSRAPVADATSTSC